MKTRIPKLLITASFVSAIMVAVWYGRLNMSKHDSQPSAEPQSAAPTNPQSGLESVPQEARLTETLPGTEPGSFSDAELKKNNLRKELDALLASQTYKALEVKMSRGEQITEEEMQLIYAKGDIEGRMVPEPPLRMCLEYPPENPDAIAMWEWWRKMMSIDSRFEYKRPIDFYGKVVDDELRPLPDVNIAISIAVPNGNEELFLKSDDQGLFSINGATGKRIIVDMRKQGYGRGPQSYGTFEYAEFFSEDFHQPDPNSPAVFVLPKLNR